MSLEFLATALLCISVVTGLTTEAIKKILDGTKIKYSSNVLAIIVSMVISIATSVVYVILNNMAFNRSVIFQMIVLVFLSFLVATLGYDKVIQTIKQFLSAKNKDIDQK